MSMSLEERHQAIVAAYEAGEKVNAIEAMFGVTCGAIYHVIRKFRVPLRQRHADRPKRVNAARLAAAVGAYRAGERTADIVTRHGMGVCALYRALRKEGVPLRHGRH
jgi:transposase